MNKMTIITISLILIVLSGCGKSKNKESQAYQEVSQKYIEMAREINRHTPVDIMENIRLDKAEALEGNIFKYYYTFKEDPKTTSDNFIKITKPLIVTTLQNMPEMQGMKNDNITIVYAYHKMDKSLFAELRIPPEEY